MAERRRVHAVVLAAGFATRLYPLTRTCAKPLLEVGGEPMLTRLVRQVAATGLVDDVTVVTNGRFHADFEAWLDALEADVAVELVCDEVTDDTANLGAIADLDLALRESDVSDPDGYLVLAGDNLFDLDLAAPIERFLDSGRAQLLLRRLEPPLVPHKYNEVELDAEGRVSAFREKPADPRHDVAAIAVYVLPRELPGLVRDHLAGGGEPDAPGHLVAALVERVPFEGRFLEGRWRDIGDATDLEAARAEAGTVRGR